MLVLSIVDQQMGLFRSTNEHFPLLSLKLALNLVLCMSVRLVRN